MSHYLSRHIKQPQNNDQEWYNFLGKPTILGEDYQNTKEGDQNYYKFKNKRLM